MTFFSQKHLRDKMNRAICMTRHHGRNHAIYRDCDRSTSRIPIIVPIMHFSSLFDRPRNACRSNGNSPNSTQIWSLAQREQRGSEIMEEFQRLGVQPQAG